jgi:hypothetical protein
VEEEVLLKPISSMNAFDQVEYMIHLDPNFIIGLLQVSGQVILLV